MGIFALLKNVNIFIDKPYNIKLNIIGIVGFD